MKTYTGTVTKNIISGGIWELQSGNEKYQIRGGDSGLRIEGQKVRVTGSIDKGGFGIGMTGPILDVKSWEAISE